MLAYLRECLRDAGCIFRRAGTWSTSEVEERIRFAFVAGCGQNDDVDADLSSFASGTVFKHFERAALRWSRNPAGSHGLNVIAPGFWGATLPVCSDANSPRIITKVKRKNECLVIMVYLEAQRQTGISSRSAPTILVSPKSFSKVIELQSGCFSRLAINCGACVTTSTCDRSAALAIKRPSAGNRSGCKLVSGSFNTSNSGGRGVNRAAIHSR